MNQANNKNCNLHNVLFEYFCEKCFEPVCKQCTLIGPHNTQNHSITTISSAYERRLMQIRERITFFVQNKASIALDITKLNQQIQKLKEIEELNIVESEKYRNKMMLQLQKSFERVTNQINLIKQEIEVKINEINDLGHTFQHIENHIEIIASHNSILQALKQCYDRVNILLSQEHKYEQLPRDLSNMRLDLKNIEVYQALISKKCLIIQQILCRLDTEKLKIQRPSIQYIELIKQLSTNIDRCIQHNVCHYCGVIFTIQNANTICKANNVSLDVNQFKGFCQKRPDSTKWATHRHYFAAPADKFGYFKTTEFNTFSIHLNSLFLKLNTILKIMNINLKLKFQQIDKKLTQLCDRISMQYILKEVCGLNDYQCQILLSICGQPNLNYYQYNDLVERLKSIEI